MGLWKMVLFILTFLKSKICFCSHKDRSSVGCHTAIQSVILQVPVQNHPQQWWT